MLASGEACGDVLGNGEAASEGCKDGVPPCEPCFRGVRGPSLSRSSLGGFVCLPVSCPVPPLLGAGGRFLPVRRNVEGRQLNGVVGGSGPHPYVLAGKNVRRRPLSVGDDALAVCADLNVVERGERALFVAESMDQGPDQ